MALLRKSFVNLSLVALSLFFLFIILETIFRIIGHSNEPAGERGYVGFHEAVYVTPNPYYPGEQADMMSKLAYRFWPNSVWYSVYPNNPRGYFEPDNSISYVINSHGLREREISPKNIKGSFRIAVIGDSFTFGEGVRADHTYSRVMEKMLQDEMPGCEVINFGHNGYDIRQIMLLLKSEVIRYEPDTVVYGYVLNDVSSYLMDTFLLETGKTEEAILLHRTPSVAVNFFIQRIWQSYLSYRTIKLYNELYHPGGPWDETMSILASMQDFLSRQNIKFIVVIFPDLSGLERRRYPFAEIHKQIKSFLDLRGIHSIDLSDAYRNFGPSQLFVHPLDPHPNEMGHQIAAEAITEALIQHDFLKSDSVPNK